jgi:hypothetical protein
MNEIEKTFVNICKHTTHTHKHTQHTNLLHTHINTHTTHKLITHTHKHTHNTQTYYGCPRVGTGR